jgi:hypothetical protein
MNCPSKNNCQVFTLEGLVDKGRREYYAETYCEAGEPQWKQCMRFRTKQELNLCPDFVLPDSTLSTDEILDLLENE